MIPKKLIGDTVKFTWINSGVTPDTIARIVFTGSETVISSESMVSSGAGSGHYYSNYTLPDTPGFYSIESRAVINGLPYKNRIRIEAVLTEVD